MLFFDYLIILQIKNGNRNELSLIKFGDINNISERKLVLSLENSVNTIDEENKSRPTNAIYSFKSIFNFVNFQNYTSVHSTRALYYQENNINTQRLIFKNCQEFIQSTFQRDISSNNDYIPSIQHNTNINRTIKDRLNTLEKSSINLPTLQYNLTQTIDKKQENITLFFENSKVLIKNWDIVQIDECKYLTFLLPLSNIPSIHDSFIQGMSSKMFANLKISQDLLLSNSLVRITTKLSEL